MPTFEKSSQTVVRGLRGKGRPQVLAYNKIPSACTIPLPDKTGMFHTTENALLRLMHKNIRNKNQ